MDPHSIHQDEELHRWPTPTEVLEEVKAIGKISGPSAITGLLLYSRSMISMLFLGFLGESELAGGSLSIGFANITGYSVLSGLAMGMEPICGQAYGAKQMKTLGLTLQRTVLLLLTTSMPISLVWLNMKRILLWFGQDEQISSTAHVFILFSIPDLLFLSILHPLRIYLRTQGITLPLTYCTAMSIILHVPLSFLLVGYLKLGIAGVAMSMVLTNLNLCFFLVSFVYFTGVYEVSWIAPSTDCLRGWSTLLTLAIPTCVSVCLEWWWYEFMVILCGLLVDPKASVASMGIMIQMTSLVYVFPSALSLGASTRVGHELGSNRPAKARLAVIVSVACAAGLGLGAMVFTTMMRQRWGRLFTKDEEVLKLTAVALPIAGMCELGNCPQTTGCGALRGSARPTTGANINLGSFYLVGMPVGVLLSFVAKLGFAGLWLGLLAAQGTCAFLMLFVLLRTDWNAQAERARELTSSSSSTRLPVSERFKGNLGMCELGNCPQTTGCGALRGSARPTTGANINLGSFYLVGMPVGVLLSFVAKLGFAGLWLGLLAAQGTCAFLMLFVLLRTDWNAQAERARELTSSSSSTRLTVSERFKGNLDNIICVKGKMDQVSIETDCLLSAK